MKYKNIINKINISIILIVTIAGCIKTKPRELKSPCVSIDSSETLSPCIKRPANTSVFS